MNCKNCGNKIDESTKFCTKCGVNILEHKNIDDDKNVHKEESFYIGKQVNKKHIEDAKRYLEPDETMIGIFHGARRSDVGLNFSQTNKEQRSRGLTMHDYLILTNKRIIMWMRGLFSSNIEGIDYDEINNLEQHQGLLLGDITFNIHGTRERFRDMVKTDVPIAAKMILDNITKSKNNQKQVRTDEDPILILKKRLAKGEINKNEYDELMKILEK